MTQATNRGASASPPAAVTYELLGPTNLPGFSHSKKTSRPGNDKGMLRFCVMAGLQSSPTMVELRQVSDFGMAVSLSGADAVLPTVS